MNSVETEGTEARGLSLALGLSSAPGMVAGAGPGGFPGRGARGRSSRSKIPISEGVASNGRVNREKGWNVRWGAVDHVVSDDDPRVVAGSSEARARAGRRARPALGTWLAGRRFRQAFGSGIEAGDGRSPRRNLDGPRGEDPLDNPRPCAAPLGSEKGGLGDGFAAISPRSPGEGMATGSARDEPHSRPPRSRSNGFCLSSRPKSAGLPALRLVSGRQTLRRAHRPRPVVVRIQDKDARWPLSPSP